MLGVSIGIVLADLQLSKYWSNICHPMGGPHSGLRLRGAGVAPGPARPVPVAADPRIRDDRDTHTREDLLRIDQGEGKHQRWCRDARPERSRRIKYP